eukprot:gene7078-7829_t
MVEEAWENQNPAKISLDGVDTTLGKLIELLIAYGPKLSGATLRLAISISLTVVSSGNKSWDELASSIMMASGVNIFLHHISSTLDPRKHVSSSILIESLQVYRLFVVLEYCKIVKSTNSCN